MANNNKIIPLSPTDITIQIVPEFLNTNNEKISIPELDIGYLVPVKTFLVDQSNQEFCGTMEITTLFFNEKIRKDLLEELYSKNIHFDIYVRQKSREDCLKVIRIYNNCIFYRQEFLVPEVGISTTVRYYFTNSDEPWEIPIEKIESLRPPNQYIYDYAVSKAIKNLQYTLKELAGNQLENSGKVFTAKEFLELVRKEVARGVCNH